MLRSAAVFDSFCGVLDIKSGALIILFFGALNKVAGVYGLISAFVGGSALQLSFYAYSAATLVIVAWGIRVVSAESTSKTTRFSHLYAIDHVIQTLYALSFARHQWFGVSHDGARGDLSVAQQDLVDLAIRRGEIPAQRPSDTAAIAHGLWEQEKTFIGFVLIVAWLVKIYFILVIYSYAAHLRSDTYHSLPLSSSSPDPRKIASVDEWASTAPRSPTQPSYRGSLNDGMTMEEAFRTPRPDGSQSTDTVAAEQEEDLGWDSENEQRGASNARRGESNS